MMINGKWMNEPEIRAYIRQLESENQKLKEELKNIMNVVQYLEYLLKHLMDY